MSWLVYGVVFSPSGAGTGRPAPRDLVGVNEVQVNLIEAGGLGAAVSWVEPSDVTPNVARVLAYDKVVEALHATQAVMPMRYGCLFSEESQVVELLRIRGEAYAAVLREVDGCVEMGVRVLSPTGASQGSLASCSGSDAHGEIDGESDVSASLALQETGRAYLTRRAAHYAREEGRTRALAAVTARLRDTLGGLAKRIKTDGGLRAGRDLASLYFLVKQQAVESFRVAFRRIEQAEEARLLLSGPSAPYNFAARERRANRYG